MRLTRHAFLRCAEMGVNPERVALVVQSRTVTYPGSESNGALVCQSSLVPDLAVVWHPGDDVVLTVLPRTVKRYRRADF